MRFQFRAVKDGEMMEGFADGGTRREVERHLRRQFDRVLEVHLAADGGPFEFLPRPWARPGPGRLAVAFRQLAVMLTAGLPLIRCLESAADSDHPALARGFTDVHESVSGGLTLSAAMSRNPHLFSPDVVGLVRAGEESGRLDESLRRITDTYERDALLRTRLTSALAYPACILAISLGVMALFVFWVIPSLEPVFHSLGAQMPGITRTVVGSARLAGNPWFLAACLAVSLLLASFFFNYFARTEEGRKRFRALLLRVPLLGPSLRRVALARLMFCMAGLLSSGVRFDAAFRLLQSTTTDPELEAALAGILRRVREGATLPEAFQREEAFGRLINQMVTVGDTSGQLPDLLYRTASTLELEVETGLERMLALVEPAVLLMLGLSSAALVLAAFMPLLELMTSL